MTLPRGIVLLVLLGSALAGCAGKGGESEATLIPPTTLGDGANNTYVPGKGFLVEGPTILPADGINRSLREDDAIHIAYALAHPSGETGRASHLVSVLLDGRVVRIDTVSLGPGEREAYTLDLPANATRDAVRVEVRAGQSVGKAEAQILDWPRVGEILDLGAGITVWVNTYVHDPGEDTLLVNGTLQRGEPRFQMFRGHALCMDAGGNVTKQGSDWPILQPRPGESQSFDLDLPSCGTDTLYGVDFKAEDGEGAPLYGRVLFVPKV